MKVAFTFCTLFALVLSQTIQDPVGPPYPHDIPNQHGPPHQQGPLISHGPPPHPPPHGPPPPLPPHCPPPQDPNYDQEPNAPNYGPDRKLSPCEEALRREREIWDYIDFFGKDTKGLVGEYAAYEQRMLNSLELDKYLKDRMDSYADYVQLRSDLRYNVPKEKFTDCGDLCQGERVDVLAVYQENVTGRDYGDDICFVIKPEVQNVFYMNCTTELSRYVQLPDGPDFTRTYACVPDGFIKRRIILWCPNALLGQCREVEVKLPMACSPKMASCMDASRLTG